MDARSLDQFFPSLSAVKVYIFFVQKGKIIVIVVILFGYGYNGCRTEKYDFVADDESFSPVRKLCVCVCIHICEHHAATTNKSIFMAKYSL